MPGPALISHHRAPTLAVVIVVGALVAVYLAWRSGRLGRLRGQHRLLNLRAELRELRISPFSFVPLLLLVIVVLVLVFAH